MNFIRSLSPHSPVGPAGRRDLIQAQREIMLQYTFYLLLFLSTAGLWPVIRLTGNPEFVGMTTFYFVAYLVLFVLTFVRNIAYALRASTVIGLLSLVALVQLYTNGAASGGIILLFIAVILANLLFGTRVGVGALIISTTSIVVAGVLMISGRITAPALNDMTNSAFINAWAVAGSLFFFGGIIIVFSDLILVRGVQQGIAIQNQLDVQLEEERASIELKVKERSETLEKKLAEFEIASEIGREVAAETDLQTLLNNSVNLVHERFGFYHVGLFLNDDQDEFTVLRAATGKVGRQMVDRNHRIKIGEVGIVGNVISRGEARIAMDVSTDVVHYKNPLLPDTRSEMALPLQAGGKTIGALDVQSTEENAFLQDDVKVLQAIANQLAIAVEKSTLLQKLQKSVVELESNQAQATRQAWQGYLKAGRRKYAYHYDRVRLVNEAAETTHANEAINSGQVVVSNVTDKDEKQVTVLAVPIKLRNQVLGVMDIQFASGMVSPDLIALIEGAVDRLAISLENARLLEEIQFRAERERLVGDISSRVRSASDIDSILRITAQEIGRSLGVAEVMVQLRNS